MKKHLKIIALTVLSVVVFEIVGYRVWSAMKNYERVFAQNKELREELKECQEKLEEYENPEKRVDRIQFRALQVR